VQNDWSKAIPRPKGEKAHWILLTALLSSCVLLVLFALTTR